MAIPNHLLAKIERRVTSKLFSRSANCYPRRPIVSCTFDDFAKSAWQSGGTILKRYDARGTFYVCGGLLNTEFNGIQLANSEDLNEIVFAGHEVGCHTLSHICLQGASAREIEIEFERNQATVSAIIHDWELRTFAYPFGATGIVGKRITAKHFTAARSVLRGINSGKIDLMQLRTQAVPEVGKDMETARRIIADLVETQGWLILYTHDVATNHSDGGCTPEQLDNVMRAASEAGCDLLSVFDAVAEIGTDTMSPANDLTGG